MEKQEKIYKAKLRIPTREQYAYLEVETEGIAQEIIDDYHLFNLLYQRSLNDPKYEPF